MRIKIVETKDYSYALDLALRDKSNTKSKDYLEKALKDNLYKLWDVYVDDRRDGVVLSFLVNNIYTLDGYNETKNFLGAVIAGKKACVELFKVTNIIWTMHRKEFEKITELTKKIGFEFDKYFDGYIILKREKTWV